MIQTVVIVVAVNKKKIRSMPKKNNKIKILAWLIIISVKLRYHPFSAYMCKKISKKILDKHNKPTIHPQGNVFTTILVIKKR